jgi:O-antigen ligase
MCQCVFGDTRLDYRLWHKCSTVLVISDKGQERMSSIFTTGSLGETETSPIVRTLVTILVFILPISACYAPAFNYTSIGLLAASLLYLVNHWRDINISGPAKLFIAASFAFPLATLVNMWVFSNWQWSWFDNPSRLILILPVFILMANIRLNPVWLCLGILFSACIFGGTAIYQSHFLGISRANGWITDLRSPITFGNAALLFSVLSLATYPLIKSEVGFKLAGLAVILAASLAAYASLLSGTRGGWISVPLLLTSVLFVDNKRPLLGKILMLLLGLGLLLVVYIAIDSVSMRIDESWNELVRMAEHREFTGGSVGARLQMWWAALLLFFDAPISGVGLGNYHAAKQILIEQGIVSSDMKRFRYAHSEVFNYLAEMGLVGIISLLVFYCSGFWLVLKRMQFNQPIAIMAFLVLMLRFDIGLTQVQFMYHYTTLLYAMMFVVLAGLMCNPHYQDR